MATPKVIILDGGYKEQEGLASAAITPGHLVQLDAATAGKVKVHATAAANAEKAFALPSWGVSGPDIDDAYVADETVKYAICERGTVVYALLAAAATAVTLGAAMESAGDGTLRIASTDAATDTTQRDSIVGYATEAVDNSAGATVARIKVRIA